MYVVVAKFTFELEGDLSSAPRFLKSLVEQLRVRFHVAAAASQDEGNSERLPQATLVISSVSHSETGLSNLIEKIQKHCEVSGGLGRVEESEFWIDSIDNFGDEDDEETKEEE